MHVTNHERRPKKMRKRKRKKENPVHLTLLAEKNGTVIEFLTIHNAPNSRPCHSTEDPRRSSRLWTFWIFLTEYTLLQSKWSGARYQKKQKNNNNKLTNQKVPRTCAFKPNLMDFFKIKLNKDNNHKTLHSLVFFCCCLLLHCCTMLLWYFAHITLEMG